MPLSQKTNRTDALCFCYFRTLLAWSSLRGWKLWARAHLVALCWWGTEKRDSITPWRSSTSRRSVRARGQGALSATMPILKEVMCLDAHRKHCSVIVKGPDILTRYSRVRLDTQLGLWYQSSWEVSDSVSLWSWPPLKDGKLVFAVVAKPERWEEFPEAMKNNFRMALRKFWTHRYCGDVLVDSPLQHRVDIKDNASGLTDRNSGPAF